MPAAAVRQVGQRSSSLIGFKSDKMVKFIIKNNRRTRVCKKKYNKIKHKIFPLYLFLFFFDVRVKEKKNKLFYVAVIIYEKKDGTDYLLGESNCEAKKNDLRNLDS